MTEPRWDLIHDAVITDDEPEPAPERFQCEHCGSIPTDCGRCPWCDPDPDVTGSDCA